MLKCLLVSPLPGMKMPKCREMSVLLGLCRAEMFASAHRLTRGEPGGYNYSAISNNQGTGTENKETKQSLKPSVSHTFQS